MPPVRKPKPPARPRLRAPDPRKQRVDINVSTGRPSHRGDEAIDQAKQSRINSNLARIKKWRDMDPNVTLTGQSTSDYYGLGQDDISQIVATRAPKLNPEQLRRLEFAANKFAPDNTAEWIHARNEGRIVDDGLGTTPSGKPNRTLRPQWIVDDIVSKYDSGQRRLTIDELAAGTAPSVHAALQQIAATRPEILENMSLYLASGPGTGPKKFADQKGLLRLLKKHRVPVFAQLYGGKAGGRKVPYVGKDGKKRFKVVPNEWSDKQWRGAVQKFNEFRKAGLDVRPLMSFSDQHIGTGPRALNEARERAWRIYRETGYIPSIWHATSVRHPSPEGLAYAAQRWTKRMRETS